jgi:hypothetical protein
VWPVPGADFHGGIAQVCWPTSVITTGCEPNREINMCRQRTMLKVLSMAFGVSLASTPLMASDATWFCSTIFEGAKEPSILKLEVKDGSLFALTHMQHVENFFAKYEARSPDITPKEYKIAEDTDKSLVAIYNYPYEEKDHTVIDLVLIDKDSGRFRQSMILMTGHEDSNYEGTCQKGK